MCIWGTAWEVRKGGSWNVNSTPKSMSLIRHHWIMLKLRAVHIQCDSELEINCCAGRKSSKGTSLSPYYYWVWEQIYSLPIICPSSNMCSQIPVLGWFKNPEMEILIIKWLLVNSIPRDLAEAKATPFWINWVLRDLSLKKFLGT